MLEFDDIQHILLTRAPALTGRYDFLSFRNPEGGRKWLAGIFPRGTVGRCNAGFGRQGESLGVGGLHLEWVTSARRGRSIVGHISRGIQTGNGRPRRDARRHRRKSSESVGRRIGQPRLTRGRDPVRSRRGGKSKSANSAHDDLVARCEGVELLSSLDLEATPPFGYAHDHFGYRDRLSQPVIEGSGDEPTPGSGAPLKPGEFILGYPDEDGPAANLPQPDVLARNGSFMAYRRLKEHVARFRDFLRAHGTSPEEQELIAAKLMGRWRSGAPLVLAPDKDDPELGADPQRNNDFNYKQMDPLGYAVPLGSHMRRMNPRDTAANMNRRRMIRRGATYGPHLPEGTQEDGVETRNCGVCDLRKLDPAVRIRPKRVGERPQLSRTR